jgi:hypothetical protein
MKRPLATLAIVVALGVGLALPANASARETHIASPWNGHQTGYYFKEHPAKLGFVMEGTQRSGYWLIKDAHWRHWGHHRTRAHGKLASADLDGTPVHIVASNRRPYQCHGKKLHFYTRAKIHIRGEGHHWRRIPRPTLVPICHR